MRSNILLPVLLGLLLPLTALPLPGQVRVSRIFGDHMVLQQDRPVRVWGDAAPGERVTVRFAGRSGTAVADAEGQWRVNLEPMAADGKAHTMVIEGTNRVELKDILLGEVWICSGQSNMEWRVHQSHDPDNEIAAGAHPRIRLFDVPGHVRKPVPDRDPRGTWKVCSPETVRDFSAVGYYFGRALQKALDVPIGLVGTNWGGTRIEPWTPPIGFTMVPELRDYAENLAGIDPSTDAGATAHEQYLERVSSWMNAAKKALQQGKSFENPPRMQLAPKGGATRIYNGMVHGLTPLSARGAIWYQGESNAGDGLRYEHMKEALVKGWRRAFENDRLAFHWVQLANFRQPTKDPAGGGWGPVREGQRRALRIPRTGMAVIIDIGEARDIHPKNKQDVGKRLALSVLAREYGHDVIGSGPIYSGMKVEGDRIRISFDHVGSGLMVGEKSGLDPARAVAGGKLARFSIKDAGGAWHWADAVIDGETVVVSCQGVSKPVAVRYGYESNPVGANLYNKEGLPASPFTTSDQ